MGRTAAYYNVVTCFLSDRRPVITHLRREHMIYTERNVKSHRRAIYQILGIGAAVVAAVLFDHAGEFCEDKYNQSVKSVQRVQRGECRFSENALFERTSCRSFEAE